MIRPYLKICDCKNLLFFLVDGTKLIKEMQAENKIIERTIVKNCILCSYYISISYIKKIS